MSERRELSLLRQLLQRLWRRRREGQKAIMTVSSREWNPEIICPGELEVSVFHAFEDH